MSFHSTLYIGPWAEWRRPLGRKGAPVEDEEPWFKSLIEGAILDLVSRDGIPEIKVGRKRYVQYRFLPRQKRPNAPPRPMSFFDGSGSEEDWSWLNPRAEIDWFSEAFAEELNVLAAYFGELPIMGWGVNSSW
jgi:hypothetical protein